MISGEYAVLKGARSLAIPTQWGQVMEVKPGQEGVLHWRSYTDQNELWFEAKFQAVEFNLVECSETDVAESLVKILRKAQELNPDWSPLGMAVNNYLEFPRNWGLGSSSTLICNIAKWAEVDAFALSEASFGGSGYDVAVGMSGSELIYEMPGIWSNFVWNPSFADQLYFVHLNQKVNSRTSVGSLSLSLSEDDISRISGITAEMASCQDGDRFQLLMVEHEGILSTTLGVDTIKEKNFQDYPYAIKSLGAWGGDFILAFGDRDSIDYFQQKGYPTVIPFKKMKA